MNSEQLPALNDSNLDDLFSQLYLLCDTEEAYNNLGEFITTAVFTEEELANPAGLDESIQMSVNIQPSFAFFQDKKVNGWQLIIVRLGDNMDEMVKRYPTVHTRFLHYSNGVIKNVVISTPIGTA
jgi:hypothetical protein